MHVSLLTEHRHPVSKPKNLSCATRYFDVLGLHIQKQRVGLCCSENLAGDMFQQNCNSYKSSEKVVIIILLIQLTEH